MYDGFAHEVSRITKEIGKLDTFPEKVRTKLNAKERTELELRLGNIRNFLQNILSEHIHKNTTKL